MPTPRALPNTDGRKSYLDDLLKADLRDECDLLDTELAELRAELDAKPTPADPNQGLLPLVLHVSGVEWNGTHKRLVRCGTGGELADSWLVQVGSKMLTRGGQSIPFRPYRQVGKSLQDKVRHSMEEGLTLLNKTRITKG